MILSDDVTDLFLPGGLQWTDRQWAPVEQQTQSLNDGRLAVRAEPRGGRPITLQSGEDYAYLSAAQCVQLAAWSAYPGQQFTLSGLRAGADRTVIFRHQDGALEFRPVDRDNDGHAAQYWRVVIRLQEVA